ncbi:hypothetical protein [Leptospira santarosai]|uniref:hypothetical protein n=1 Tax=Leptospira santarosai TaxID=28183 RepID=UPI000774345C|nr:hypothetical protein [Leptospira santarosai]ASV12353.1 hypothetical protein B2G51_12395 [Leptospira santarosai]MDI7208904.1 hypothetical protein [Leptospira santarosai]MDO6381428.1 hypothetical protein [Leptospira santarosai]OLY65226.1 hypothetical protein BWD11_04805 [Leptospira santarosai serovar Grippotyphosa]ONF77639.1 hypothetical protein BWD12_14780 [Leptospira santarosai serovar Bananal]
MENKSYYISVDEPWNFEGPDGKNIIKGEILKIIDRDCVLFKTNHILNIDNKEGNILVLISRHSGSGYHFDTLEINGFWTFGGGILLTQDYENMDRKELEKNSKYIIIGSFDSEPERRKN